MALFCKFRSVTRFTACYSVGFAARTRGLREAYVDVHCHGNGDMLPGAPCLQSFQFVQRSLHRSGKRGFMPLEVFEWLCKHFQDPRDFERKIIELSSRARELLLVISKSFAFVR